MIRIILALILTLVIECALCIVLYRDKKTAYHVFLANILTNPAMNVLLIGIYTILIMINVSGMLYIPFLIIFEIVAVFVEYRVYRFIGHDKKKSLVMAIALNVISFGLGLLIFPIAFY
ncbi:MAG: hypothetical protein R3Y18_03090 [Bacillota bacterium]